MSPSSTDQMQTSRRPALALWASLPPLNPPRAGACGSRLFPLQELEQQLMMEKRNFRKTLKFYQKLLQKEKRNKGSLTGPGPGWGQGSREGRALRAESVHPQAPR